MKCVPLEKSQFSPVVGLKDTKLNFIYYLSNKQFTKRVAKIQNLVLFFYCSFNISVRPYAL